MAKIISKEYTLKNINTNEIITVQGMTKEEACATVNLKAREYKVIETKNIYQTLTVRKHLTNAELIAILSRRNPNEEVAILLDYSLYNCQREYNEIDEKDGICYVEEDNQLVISGGEFEC